MTMRRTIFLAAIAASLAYPVLAGDAITIAGSSTVQPVVEDAAKAFEAANPGTRFVISGGGSSHGVQACAAGQITIGMSSRNVSDKERAESPDLVQVKLATDGIAIIVHKDNPLTAITKEQLQKVYSGQITNWSELGGTNSPIVLIAKQEGRSTLELFNEYVGLEHQVNGEGPAARMVHKVKGGTTFSTVTAQMIGQNREAIGQIMTKPNAIAYVSVGTAQEVAAKGGKVKCLDLEGIAATVDNVASGAYPLLRPLTVVTKGAPTGTAKAFINYLMGPDGQALAAKHEFVPNKSGV